MASKKQHAAIDFQGAAKITVGGSAGSSGQVLTSGGSGAMTWTAKTCGGVTKKVYDIVWDSAYSSAGVTWESGDAAGVVTITHSLGTYGVIVSVKDTNSAVTDNDNEQIDLGYPSACVVKVHSNQIIKLQFDTEPAANKQFYVTIIG